MPSEFQRFGEVGARPTYSGSGGSQGPTQATSKRRQKKVGRPAIGSHETAITRANGGLHSVRHYREAIDWLEVCAYRYREPRLFHLVFQCARETGDDYARQKYILKRLAQELRRHGVPNGYRAAREVDMRRGEHLHAFVVVDAAEADPGRLVSERKDGWLYQAAAERHVEVFLNRPRNLMHQRDGGRRLDYVELRGAALADAKIWISYLFKTRSKPAQGQIYSASRG